jgi:alkyl hydroperoxide reductase subunit F
MLNQIYDTIIIGAGPAGLTAALYTGRNSLNTLVLSKDLGGQTAISGEIGNFPGVPAIEGYKLIAMIKQQVDALPTVEINTGEDFAVKELNQKNKLFTITDTAGNEYQAKTVIVTSGKTHRKLGVPGEAEFEGRGVNYCATCDGPLYRNKIVAIIGGGYSATEAAYMLDKYASKIYVLTINPEMKGERVTLDKLAKSDKIEIIADAVTTEILHNDMRVTGVKYKNDTTGESKELSVQGVFVAIGSVPNTNQFGDLAKLNKYNEIEIDSKNMTSVPGLFAAGDVTTVWGKQSVIAAGEGAKAAMAVGEFLASK